MFLQQLQKQYGFSFDGGLVRTNLSQFRAELR